MSEVLNRVPSRRLLPHLTQGLFPPTFTTANPPNRR
jgi:hypothetical protein